MTLQGLLQAVTPAGAFAAGLADTGQAVQSYPEETLLMTNAVAKRQREFMLGRACARAALAPIGHGAAMLGRKADGAPLWPDGIVGSISHTDGQAVALAARDREFRGLGVDVERRGRVTPDLYRHIFESEERTQLEAMPASGRDALAALLFSAKEASCKIWLGSHGGPQPFTGIRITLAGTDFTAQFPMRGYATLQGRAALGESLVLAAAWEPA
ncbi:MAG TPA: 4'-phosphopantetheinyl transferase superfamily protein [Rhizomicrobium sp.]|nr:4'-phosphopantetheinyl transferase superfamily protein [Rhizomicrobium sp.]